jgi:hypothetical protein
MQRMKTIWKELSDLHSHRAKYLHVYQLIKGMKNIFEKKLRLYFLNKETILGLNGYRIEAFSSNLLT